MSLASIFSTRLSQSEFIKIIIAMISLVIGLGNIGSRYKGTRHNLGFEVADLAVKKTGGKELPEDFYYQVYGYKLEDRKVIIAKPTTLMNRSGETAIALLDTFDLTPSEMLVVVDDFNIPLGSIRLRGNGSAGGHNGIHSIIEALGTEEFPRLRLGVGPVPEGVDSVDFVLGKFGKSERKIAKKMIGIAAEAVIFAAGHSLEVAMSKYNYNPA